MNNTIKISDREKQCLKVLMSHGQDDYCFFFKGISNDTKLTIIQVRRSVRSLARKGLAELIRGLIDDDGMLAGSGYIATDNAFKLFRELYEE